jgi:hypothetical protein
MKRLLLIFIAMVVCIIPVTAMPEAHENVTVDENTITTFDPVYKIQDNVMPFTLWALIYGTGVLLLLVSVLLHERGGIVTGLLSLGFIVIAWINSVFIGFQDVVTHQMGTSLVIQPVITVYGSHSLHLLLFLTFLVGVLNVILGALTVLTESAHIKQYNQRVGLK